MDECCCLRENVARLHFVRRTLLRFTAKSPMGYIAFDQGEHSIKTGPETAEYGCFGPVLIEFPHEIDSHIHADHGEDEYRMNRG
jgi:hypothetical protein